uniref:Protein TsetseEP domain-containing protein n=1 Tax=Anopheles maculatus TaxID=74869 RepID=A0A182SDZ8_9DIPT
MNQLVLAFGIVCLLQEKIEAIISGFDTKTQAILTAYDSLLADTSKNADTAFTPFISAISAAETYISGDGAAFGAALAQLTYTGISDELTDAFQRVLNGLGDLKSKTGAVKTAIAAAINGAPDGAVTEVGLRQFLSLKMMYDLLKSATTLRAYLPLVTYILQTAKENVVEADTFLMSLKNTLNTDVSSVAAQFASGISAKTAEIKTEVATRFAADASSADSIDSAISAMTGINAATKYADLTASITVLKNLFTSASLSAQTTSMGSAFASITSSLGALITSLQAAVSVNDNALVISLVNTLVGNDEYGRYCYHKYKDLVKGLFDQGFDAGWQCVDKELLRLEHLRITLNLVIDLLVADFEDVTAQVGVCNQLTNADNLNTCVSALATFYTELFKATKDKIAVVYQLAIDEATAVENRLLICFQLVNLDTSITQVAAIANNLAICSVRGPTGTD